MRSTTVHGRLKGRFTNSDERDPEGPPFDYWPRIKEPLKLEEGLVGKRNRAHLRLHVRSTEYGLCCSYSEPEFSFLFFFLLLLLFHFPLFSQGMYSKQRGQTPGCAHVDLGIWDSRKCFQGHEHGGHVADSDLLNFNSKYTMGIDTPYPQII